MTVKEALEVIDKVESYRIVCLNILPSTEAIHNSEYLLKNTSNEILNKKVYEIKKERRGVYDAIVIYAKEDDKVSDNKPNLMEAYNKNQEFIKLIGESTHDLLKAASMMGKTNSIEEFVEFLYKNGYKIVKDDKEN